MEIDQSESRRLINYRKYLKEYAPYAKPQAVGKLKDRVCENCSRDYKPMHITQKYCQHPECDVWKLYAKRQSEKLAKKRGKK